MYKFVTAVWGTEYIKLFLEIALPTQLTPRNLPAFAERVSAVYFIYTKKAEKELITNSSIYKKLLSYIEVKIIEIDDIIDKKLFEKIPHYPMRECHQHFIRNERREGTSLIFLSPDIICTDGSFSSFLKVAEQGKRLIAIAALRLDKDTLVPEFAKNFIENGNCIPCEPRTFVKFCLNHLHPDTKALFMDSGISNLYPSVWLWNIKDEGILIKAFHLHPLLVKPPSWNKLPKNTIDEDLILNIPSEDIYIFDDSDDLCFFEMSSPSYRKECIVQHPQTTEFLCEFVCDCTNFRHKEFVRTPIRLHYTDWTDKWTEVEKEADRLLDDVMKYSRLLDKIFDCPNNRRFFEGYIIKTWSYLGFTDKNNKKLKVAIYGAGKHTEWMNNILDESKKLKGPEVVAVLDDNPNGKISFFNKVPVKTESFAPADADAIIISSDIRNKEMAEKCRKIFGNKIEIIDLYENFPPGPYPKRIDMEN